MHFGPVVRRVEFGWMMDGKGRGLVDKNHSLILGPFVGPGMKVVGKGWQSKGNSQGA